MNYTTIHIQGNLLSEEILQKVESGEAQGQKATDFGFEPGANLRSEIEYAWSRIKLDWKHFSDKAQNLPASDPYGTTLSRKWMEQFLSSVGFELSKEKAGLAGDNNKTYTISHTAGNLEQLPVHIVGFTEPNHPDKNTLDIKTSGGTSRLSPHATMQEYLNVSGHVYGIAANGLFLRLIRDSGRLIKLSYVEFDLKRMLEEDKYSEFTLLYRLLHASRFPRTKTDADQCFLEKYYQDSIESGHRIREGLSLAVKESLLALGLGFLQNENNERLRNKIQNGQLPAKDYYRQLLRIIYRFLFLMVTEERDLIYDPDDKSVNTQRLKSIYLQYYSIARLRRLSEKRYVYESRFNDLWQGLVQTFQLFEAGGHGKKLGIQPLDGDLFGGRAIEDLEDCFISNKLLLECVRNMNEFRDENKNLVNINYRSLDVEELGSVYEGLLELHPVIENIEAENPAHIHFTFHEGTDRKTTGSYYTRPELVNELIKSALIPVIEERLKKHTGNSEAQAHALLKLKVCDAAAGSGHMLLAAARTIAWYLARVQSGEENPAPSVYRKCLREVIQHCIYAVDFNPDAVELCKLALWLEGHNSGKPLSFLDHKIRNGNSLVGVTDLSVLQQGIPDDAFNPVTGDDKKICQELKKENAKFNKTKQGTLDFDQSEKIDTTAIAADYEALENQRQDDVEGVRQAQTKFEKLRSNHAWFNDWRACNLWTAAFFWNYTEANKQAAPNSERLAKFLSNPAAAYGPMTGKADALSMEHKFFHWPLEFPDVFDPSAGSEGFDVMLGNPPWEKLQAEEEEFFKGKNNEIANDKNAERRKENIEKLNESDIELYNGWNHFRNSILRISKFIIQSDRFPYSAKGNLNLYKVFVELVRSHINKAGRGGLVVQSGLFTDELSKELLENLMSCKNMISAYDFINVNKLFQIDSRMRFSLITFSRNKNVQKAEFSFYLKSIEEISHKGNKILMDYSDIKLINPNTFVCPQISSQFVFDLLKKMYSEKLVIKSDIAVKSFGVGFWGEMFNMTRAQKYLHNTIDITDTNVIPLYEAKYFHHYDHPFATFEGKSSEDCMKGNTDYITESAKALLKLPFFRYYVNTNEVEAKCEKYELEKKWLLCVRSITSATNERTVISAILPKKGVGNSANIALINDPLKAAHLIGTFNSLLTDFIAQTKVGNQNFNIYIIEQLPILNFDRKIISAKIIEKVLELIYTSWDIKAFADDVWKEAGESDKIKDKSEKYGELSALQAAIVQQWEENKAATGGHAWAPPEWHEDYGWEVVNGEWRMVNGEQRMASGEGRMASGEHRMENGELRMANSATPLATGHSPLTTKCPLPPFKWDEERRAVLKAELDAIYAKLYGLTTEELRYILDPQDVYGPDFPGETFRVLKEKEIRQYGEYRTRRLVLEAWERLNKEEQL